MTISVGSVSVDVVPDATDFWRQFRARTRSGADRAGTALGNALGDPAGREARRQIEEHLHDLTATVRVNTRGDEDLAQAERNMSGLVTAVAALGPALVPIGAVAAGAMAGLVGTAGTAALAVLGVNRAIKDGTSLGDAYSAQLAGLKSSLAGLENTAAGGVLGGFSDAVATIQGLMPAVNRDVATFSTQLGAIVSHVAPGLVGLFHDLEPLFQTFGDDLVDGSKKFQDWASSSSALSTFVSYVQAQLPMVEHTLGELFGAAGHVIQAFAPFGGTVLTLISTFASVINEIPVGVLQALVPLIVGFRGALLGLKVASTAATAVRGMSAAMLGVGGIAAAAGVALAVFSAKSAAAQQRAAEAAASTDQFTQALIDNKLAVDKQITAQAAKELSDKGAYGTAAQLGISQQELTQAALHQGDAYEKVTAKLKAYSDSALDNNHVTFEGVTAKGKDAVAANLVGSSLKAVSEQYANATTKAKEQLGALKSTAAAQKGAKTVAEQYRDALHSIASVSANMRTTVNGVNVAMKGQITAVDALQTALGILSGNAISAEQAELQLKDSLGQLTQSVKTNGRSLSENTSKGRANKEAILGLIQQANAHAEAVQKQTGSVDKATTALGRDEAAIRTAAKAAGFNKDQIDAMIRKYAAVPSQVRTEILANTTSASKQIEAIKKKIKGLDGWTVDAYVNVQTRMANGQPVHIPGLPGFRALGGIVSRPTFISPWDVAGEAGREAIVPLDKPPSMVDPSVRWLAQIAQGMPWAQGSSAPAPVSHPSPVNRTGMHVENLQIVTPNPQAAADEMQRRIQLLAV